LEKILLFPFYREENEDNLSRAVLRIKSMALCMLGMCCTDELYPQKGRYLLDIKLMLRAIVCAQGHTSG
jgi:hypothetical protein